VQAAEYVTKELAAQAKVAKLKGFEVVAAVHVEREHWTVENDLVTPSLKLKRPALKKKYADTIAQLYADTKAKK
jgi:long-chain acyl-CoA synthetase